MPKENLTKRRFVRMKRVRREKEQLRDWKAKPFGPDYAAWAEFYYERYHRTPKHVRARKSRDFKRHLIWPQG